VVRVKIWNSEKLKFWRAANPMGVIRVPDFQFPGGVGEVKIYPDTAYPVPCPGVTPSQPETGGEDVLLRPGVPRTAPLSGDPGTGLTITPRDTRRAQAASGKCVGIRPPGLTIYGAFHGSLRLTSKATLFTSCQY
jgi:hypothetical protein